MRVLLVSHYELGHQPLGLAAPAAVLRAQGHDVACVDLAVQAPETARFRDAEFIGLSVPMHTAARLAIALASRLRRINPGAHLAFYGLYAPLIHDSLRESGLADSVVGGEYETALAAVAEAVAAGRFDPSRPAAGSGELPLFPRRIHPVPDRRGLPALSEYAHLDLGGARKVAGYVEASRGCAHRCRHCPITPVYGGRLRLVRPEVVAADIDQLVAMGAQHITFGDPDFLNAVPHSLRIVEAMRERHPHLTFDATIKVEHLLEHGDLLVPLRDLGCLFITSAFESLNDSVLAILDKGHTRADLYAVVGRAVAAGLTLRPTWLPFTPWSGPEDFLEVLEFVEERDLIPNVQPVQYALRLLVPPRSALIERLRADGALGPYDDAGLTYRWTHSDPRVDALQAEVARVVEAAAQPDADGHVEETLTTFRRVKRLALAALGRGEAEVEVRRPSRSAVPGLTEAWFC